MKKKINFVNAFKRTCAILILAILCVGCFFCGKVITYNIAGYDKDYIKENLIPISFNKEQDKNTNLEIMDISLLQLNARREESDDCKEIFDESYWESATNEEKEYAASMLAHYSVYSLGVNEFIYFYVDDLEEGTFGEYDDSSKSITIDREHLYNDSSYNVVDTVFHEARHCYQHACIEMYDELLKSGSSKSQLAIFDFSREMEESFYNYNSCESENDFEEYRYQACEDDAFIYAKNQANAFFADIAHSE